MEVGPPPPVPLALPRIWPERVGVCFLLPVLGGGGGDVHICPHADLARSGLSFLSAPSSQSGFSALHHSWIPRRYHGPGWRCVCSAITMVTLRRRCLHDLGAARPCQALPPSFLPSFPGLQGQYNATSRQSMYGMIDNTRLRASPPVMRPA